MYLTQVEFQECLFIFYHGMTYAQIPIPRISRKICHYVNYSNPGYYYSYLSPVDTYNLGKLLYIMFKVSFDRY